MPVLYFALLSNKIKCAIVLLPVDGFHGRGYGQNEHIRSEEDIKPAGKSG